MNTSPLIVHQIEIPSSVLPQWDQFSQECQNELIQALAAQLFVPEMTLERRLEIAAQMCGLLGAVSQAEWIPPPVPQEAEII